MTIEVFSDIACPWCFVGKRRLERALAVAPTGPVAIQYHAFELRPDMPADGLDGPTFYAAKFGGRARVEAVHERLCGIGRDEGIAFAFDKMRAPNTRLGHRAIALAAAHGRQNAAVDALFRGQFEASADITKIDQILALFRDHGVALDLDDMRARLDAGEGTEAVLADERRAASLGIDGVPFFIVAGKYAFSGAQPPEAIARVLAMARDPKQEVA